MQRSHNHLPLDLLELYLLNRVNQTEEQQTEEHLLVCDRCRSLATTLEQEISLVKSALRRITGTRPNSYHFSNQWDSFQRNVPAVFMTTRDTCIPKSVG